MKPARGTTHSVLNTLSRGNELYSHKQPRFAVIMSYMLLLIDDDLHVFKGPCLVAGIRL